jgi:LacI family transcriptional regulator
MASQKDIAAELGVSVSLVSKVLNHRMGTSGVTPEMAERINRKAREMNYHKNTSAYALRQGRHDAIGVYIHRHGERGSGLIQDLILGISTEARRRQQKISLSFFNTADEFYAMSEQVHRGMFDGMIVGGFSHSDLGERLLQVCEEGVPVVTVQNRPVDARIGNIAVSEEQIGYIGTRHLIEQGCRRVGHIRVQTVPGRYEGFCRAMAEGGLAVDPDLIFDSGELRFALGAGEAVAQRIVERGLELDGLVTESDTQAAGALNVLLGAGYDVPGQLKLIGVDDSPFCEYFAVPISSVSQQHEMKGRLAMEMVLAAVRGDQPQSILVEPVVKARQSSGAEILAV